MEEVRFPYFRNFSLGSLGGVERRYQIPRCSFFSPCGGPDFCPAFEQESGENWGKTENRPYARLHRLQCRLYTKLDMDIG